MSASEFKIALYIGIVTNRMLTESLLRRSGKSGLLRRSGKWGL